jgi:uncharacterized protein YdbL (DUF1318 family)
MRNNRHRIAAATLALCLTACLAALPALAGELKDRMLERLPTITALKAEGVVGENNRGYLEFRSPEKSADVVKAENADRTTVYNAIARKANTTPELVGQRRAGHIAEKAAAGTWLQDGSGTWYRK